MPTASAVGFFLGPCLRLEPRKGNSIGGSRERTRPLRAGRLDDRDVRLNPSHPGIDVRREDGSRLLGDRNLEPALAQQSDEILLVCEGLAAGPMKLETNRSDKVQALL